MMRSVGRDLQEEIRRKKSEGRYLKDEICRKKSV